MSDGLTLFCPGCGKRKALNHEYDFLPVKLMIKKFAGVEWYDSRMPVFTCPSCDTEWVIERVIKDKG